MGGATKPAATKNAAPAISGMNRLGRMIRLLMKSTFMTPAHILISAFAAFGAEDLRIQGIHDATQQPRTHGDNFARPIWCNLQKTIH
jgi:hypothetical protein